MAYTRTNNGDAPLTEMELERLVNIRRNNEILASLIPLKPQVQHGQPKKRTKRTHNTSAAANEHHNLRPRPERNSGDSANQHTDEDLDCESAGEFLCDNEDVHTSPQKKRNGRKITKMEDVFARTPDMPKIRITLNEHGQPVGQNSRQLSSVVGCLVRKKLTVRCLDWRLIDAKEKDAVWDEVQKFYDIDDAGKNWFFKNAGMKWKEFKATLKEHYFDGNLTDEDLRKRHGDRVNDEDWDFLVDYWKTPESDVRSKIGKVNRSKSEIQHTSGIKSFARSAHEMADELGRPPRRDELYVKTHTKKNGVPITNAELNISKLKATVEAHPELIDKTIQQGDIFSVALGSKEPRGRVRALGLGPTPQDVGIAGLKSYTPTRFQMEVLARKKAESKNEALEQHLTQMERQMEMMEARFAQERRNAEVMSQNGSNSQQHVSPRPAGHGHEAYHDAHFQEDEAYEDNENNDVIDVGEYLLVERRIAAPTMQSPSNATLAMQPHAAKSSQCIPTNEIPAVQPNVAPTMQPLVSQLSQPHVAKPAQPQVAKPAQNNVANLAQTKVVKPSHDEYIGRDVILYEVVRSNAAVAKGKIISVNPKTTLGGVALGRHYCEVVVNLVIKRDAILPRPYAGVEKMADALKLPIAWPYNRLKVSKASTSNHGTSGERP